jgi:hypothetical protein
MRFEPTVKEVKHTLTLYGRCLAFLYFHSRRGDKKAAYVLKMADTIAKRQSIEDVVEYVEHHYPDLRNSPLPKEILC